MQYDPLRSREMQTMIQRRRPRSNWARLLEALLALAGGEAELLRHAERPWASATFSGSRHTVGLSFSGTQGLAAGEEFITALPDHEFAIPGQLVADADVTEVSMVMLPEPKLTVEIELLLLDDA